MNSNLLSSLIVLFLLFFGINTQAQDIFFKNVAQSDTLEISNLVNSLALDKQNNVWLTSERQVIFFGDSTAYVIDSLIEANVIKIDKNNQKWIGTYRGQILILDSLNKHVKTIQITPCNQGKSNCSITDIEFNKNQTWIATNGSGYFSLVDDTLISIKGMSEYISNNIGTNKISDLQIDSSNVLWVASENGLFSIKEKGRGKIKKYTIFNEARTITLFHNELWVSGISKKYKPVLYSYKKGKWTKFHFQKNLITSVINKVKFIENKQMYIASNKLIKYDFRDKKYTVFDTTNNIRSNGVSDVLIRDSIIWVATRDKGLYRSYNKIDTVIVDTTINTNANDSLTINNEKSLKNKDSVLVFNGEEIHIRDTIQLKNILFDKGTAKLKNKISVKILENFLKNYPNIVIELSGHTEADKSFYTPKKIENHQKLSFERVETVKNYLISKKIDKKRIKIIAYGGTKPFSKTDESLNRRVELRIIENDFNPKD